MTPPVPRSKLTKDQFQWMVGLFVFACLTWSLYNFQLRPALDVSQSTNIFSDVKDIDTSLMIYIQDSDNVFPPVQSQTTFRKLINPYLGHEGASNSRKFENPDWGVEIRYNTSLSNVKLNSIGHPDEVLDLWTPFSPNLDAPPTQFICGFVDGGAQSIKSSDWSPYQATLNQAFPRVSDDFYPPDFGAP